MTVQNTPLPDHLVAIVAPECCPDRRPVVDPFTPDEFLREAAGQIDVAQQGPYQRRWRLDADDHTRRGAVHILHHGDVIPVQRREINIRFVNWLRAENQM